MGRSTEAFVGIDVAKLRNAIAIADGERGGEIRFLGEVDASGPSMRRLVQRIAARHEPVQFCYEAGPTGYGLHRLITSLGHACTVVAPSLVPRKPSDRVKINRRDAVALAKLLRAGELTPVWVPDEGHEAMRDLVRARAAAVDTLRVHRQQVSAFMLKHSSSTRSRPACRPISTYIWSWTTTPRTRPGWSAFLGGLLTAAAPLVGSSACSHARDATVRGSQKRFRLSNE